jgi:hypothetical protein
MKSRGLILAGILLVCLALIMFIYVLEVKTVFKELPSELTYADTIKNVGYLVAVASLTLLIWGLIILYKTRAVLETLYNQRNMSTGKGSDRHSSISIVRFGCLNCTERITAEYLPDKDTIRCPHCGVVNLVPKEAVAAAEDVFLQDRMRVISNIISAAGDTSGLPLFVKVLAWVNLVILTAAGIFLLIKGVPSQVENNIYWGLGLAYAGIIIAALLYSMSAISINIANRIQREAKTF